MQFPLATSLKLATIFHSSCNIVYYKFRAKISCVPDWPVYTAPAHTGLLFILPPKQSDFCSAYRITVA